MNFFYLVRGNWLWIVWAGIAVCVVVGYIRVRHHLHRVEAAGDAASAEARTRHAAEHAKKKPGRVE
jgi:hypothetical protein